MSSEHISQVRNQWEKVVRDTLAGKEYFPDTFYVFPIVGRLRSGKTTISDLVTEWFEERDGLAVETTSAGDKILQHQIGAGGRLRSPLGHYERSPEVDRQVDLETAQWMIDPENAGKLLIPEGRVLGYTASKLEKAAKDLSLPLPGSIHPILLVADQKTRFEREYNQLHRINPNISEATGIELATKRELGEDIVFPMIYPDLLGKNLYDPYFKDPAGDNVYQLILDTSDHSAGFCATKIYEFIRETIGMQPPLQR